MVKLEENENKIVLEKGSICIKFDYIRDLKIENCWVSNSYGYKQSSKKITIPFSKELSIKMTIETKDKLNWMES